MTRHPSRGRLRYGSTALAIAALLLGTTHLAQARITKIVLNAPTFPFGTQTFGSYGQYEELDGTAYGEVDPNDPTDAVIQDINLAPADVNGHVKYSMNISILKPVTGSGNGVLLYDVVNRGNKIIPGFFNVGVSSNAPAGDGFLENQGFIMAWSGWQGDLVKNAGLITATVPVANTANGGTITGVVRSEISMLTTTIQTSPILGGFSTSSIGYQPVSTDTTKATLTERVHEEDPRDPIPSNQWAFGSCNPTFPNVTPDPANATQYHVCKAGGFDPNHIYELIYQGENPFVLGLGFAATRDFVSYLHHSTDSANPMAGAVQHTLMHGTSQSGRFVRGFLQLGFNQDENNRIVFEGMNPHIASARVALDIRFGQPGRVAGLQHTEHEYPGAESPITWNSYHDPLQDVTGGLLERCRQTNTCPKILQTVTDTEFWQSVMSSDITDAYGLQDLTLPNDVRLYHFASTQHGGSSPLSVLPPAATPVCQQLPNANSYTYNLRAVLIALENWVVNNTAPPASRYPRISKGTLVRPEQVAFPLIPNVSEELGVLLNRRSFYDRGPRFDGFNEAGYESVEPPVRIADYTTLAPQVDADGNDIDGVHSLQLMVPLGTYTGWNTRAAGFGEGDACDLTGSFIPFPTTSANANGDPRTPIATRYPTTAAYNSAVQAAAQTLVSQGFLLPSDEANAVSQVETQAHNSGLLPP